MTTLYIVDGESKEVIEQPLNFQHPPVDVNNEDGYASILFHGVSIHFTKEEAEEKLKYLETLKICPDCDRVLPEEHTRCWSCENKHGREVG